MAQRSVYRSAMASKKSQLRRVEIEGPTHEQRTHVAYVQEEVVERGQVKARRWRRVRTLDTLALSPSGHRAAEWYQITADIAAGRSPRSTWDRLGAPGSSGVGVPLAERQALALRDVQWADRCLRDEDRAADTLPVWRAIIVDWDAVSAVAARVFGARNGVRDRKIRSTVARLSERLARELGL
jgi:hypothetical protein